MVVMVVKVYLVLLTGEMLEVAADAAVSVKRKIVMTDQQMAVMVNKFP